MKVTYNWLRDYVKIDTKPQDLANKLTMAGLEVTSLKELGNDYLLEVEATSNRPDWLSIAGIAREIASIQGESLNLPKQVKLKSKKSNINTPNITISAKEYCTRYIGIVIRNVKVGASPDWLKQRLEHLDIRCVNNIVDITNYCLLEQGQPIHAFDLDKLNKDIFIRCAKKGETIRTIDDELRKLDESILVIADKSVPVAIAGIMGGKDTEVQDTTKNILLEVAVFDPIVIRKGAKKLGLSSDASYRFERGVDLDNCMNIATRCAGLILDLAGTELSFVDRIIDVGKKSTPKRAVAIRSGYAGKMLGVSVGEKQIKKILVSLGLKYTKKAKDELHFLMPSLRRDLKIEQDLIEEIARIYGFDKIPESLAYIKPKDIQKDKESILLSLVKDNLVKQGLNEVITYSLIGKSELDLLKIDDQGLPQIENPLSANQAFLRPTILAGLLNVVANNLNHQNPDIKIFEIGSIFKEEERPHLAIALTGQDYSGVLQEAGKFQIQATILHLKGIIENLLIGLGVKGYSFREINSDIFKKDSSLGLVINNIECAKLGSVSSGVLSSFDIKKEDIFLAEVDLRKLSSIFNIEKEYTALNPYPFITRHISLFIKKNIKFQEIIDAIKELNVNYLENIELIDFYIGKNAPAGNKGLTISLKFQAKDHTLKEEEIEPINKSICSQLQNRLNAVIR